MMKSNAHLLLLGLGLLVGISNAHVESHQTEITIVNNVQGDEKASAETISPVVAQVCTALATMVTDIMHHAVEESSSHEGNFNYTNFSQTQAERFPSLQQEIIDHLSAYDLSAAQTEQLGLFVTFMMDEMGLFLQKNSTISLNLMQATTKEVALETIKPFDQFMLSLSEQFTIAFAVGEIKKPAEIKFLDDADVDYSTDAFRGRVATLLSDFIDLMENLKSELIQDCTDEDGHFDGKYYIEQQGATMQKASEQGQAWLDKVVQNGIAEGDMYHIVTFLTQSFPQAAMKHVANNPDCELNMVAAKTEADALDLMDEQFTAFNTAKKQYLNENFPEEEVETIVIVEIATDEDEELEQAEAAV